MSEAFRVLFVCTGNICRSPAAARLLQAALARSPAADGAKILVTSAGTHGLVGYGIDPPVVRALAAWQVDSDGHQARRLGAAEVAEADLVLGATRVHRAAAVSLHPKAVHYAYTITEFARLASSVLGRPGYAAAGPVELMAEVRRLRGTVRAPHPGADDVADPYGRSAAEHAAAVTAIAAASDVIAAALLRAGEKPTA